MRRFIFHSATVIIRSAYGLPSPPLRMTPSAESSALPSASPSRPILGDRELEPYRADLYRRVSRYLRRHEDREDAVQETYVKALRYLEGFDGRCSLRTWLWGIADGCALEIIRRSRHQWTGEGLEELTASTASPLRIVESAEALARVEAAPLTKRERRALALQCEEGLSATQIAFRLQTTQGTVRVMLCRARRKLRAAA